MSKLKFNIVGYESVELTREEWDKLIAIEIGVLERLGIPFGLIQTKHRPDHWLSNYMKFINEVSND